VAQDFSPAWGLIEKWTYLRGTVGIALAF